MVVDRPEAAHAEVLGDLPDQPVKRRAPHQRLRGVLVAADLPQSHRARPGQVVTGRAKVPPGELQGVSPHWTAGNLAKSQAIYEIRVKNGI